MGGRDMISIFYRAGGCILLSQSETDFEKLNRNDVLWIDLFAPEGNEKLLGRHHYSPNNPDRNYTLYLWDSPVFLVDRSTFSEINTDTLSEGFNNEF